MEGASVRVEHTGITESPIFIANDFIIQHTDYEYILTFAFLHPPPILSDSDLKRIHHAGRVESKAVARVVLPEGRLRQLVGLLQDNIAQYERRVRLEGEDDL